VPNQPKTPVRSVRISDDLWDKAQRLADRRGENISDVVRDALAAYVDAHTPGRKAKK